MAANISIEFVVECFAIEPDSDSFSAFKIKACLIKFIVNKSIATVIILAVLKIIVRTELFTLSFSFTFLGKRA